jgi:hypothetical protein
MTDKERIELAKVHADLQWVLDILVRIEEVVDKDPFISSEATDSVKWLIKQGLKVKREE